MADQKTREAKVNSSVKAHSRRILILAAVIAAVLAMAGTVYGKYASWLMDSTQAVASNFCFDSNLLKDPSEEKNYDIPKWEKLGVHSITLEMHNYENSLIWNEPGTGCFYYLDLHIYDDENCTMESNKFNLSYVIDKHNDQETDQQFGVYTKDGKEYKVAYIPGMENFSKDNGAQDVVVGIQSKIADDASLLSTYYLKVDAYSIPYTEIRNISVTGSNSISTSGTAVLLNGAEIKDNIYFKKLSAKFSLGAGNAGSRQSYQVEQHQGRSQVKLSITTDSTADIRLYFNPETIRTSGADTEILTDENDHQYILHKTTGGTESSYLYKVNYGSSDPNAVVRDSLENEFSDFYADGEYKADIYLLFPSNAQN